MLSGLPELRACSAKICFSLSKASALTEEISRLSGRAAAICIAILLPSSNNLALSPVDSNATNTPILPKPSEIELCI